MCVARLAPRGGGARSPTSPTAVAVRSSDGGIHKARAIHDGGILLFHADGGGLFFHGYGGGLLNPSHHGFPARWRRRRQRRSARPGSALSAFSRAASPCRNRSGDGFFLDIVNSFQAPPSLSTVPALEVQPARAAAEIVAAQVLEEATEEEINDVANLAETCLRLRGEERPTMKQVEMILQSVRSKRLRSCQVAPRNEDIQPLLSGQRRVTRLPLTAAGDMANSASQRNQNCYSLEQEFMESSTLPR